MSLATDMPVRANGFEILAAWFNNLRDAILSFTGTESSAQTPFAGSASQSDTVVTGLIFDETVSRRAVIEYTIVTSTKKESGEYIALFDGADWIMYTTPYQGDDSLITLDIVVSTGQVTYSSDSETFTLDHKVTTFNL